VPKITNEMLANKIAKAAVLFADRVQCGEGDVLDVKACRAAFEELFEVWRDVDKGLVDEGD